MKLGFWVSLVMLTVSKWAIASSTLTFSEFISLVESQSPELKIEKALTDETSAKSNGIRIPPPMVGMMQMKDAAGTNQGFEVSQEIPFPSKISKEKEVRKLEAQAQKEILTYRKSEILSAARTAYFEFWNAFERSKLITEKRDWLKKHAKLARTTARSDSTAQLHLLEIESEVDMLENEVLESESILLQNRIALKAFAPNANFDQVEPKIPSFKNMKIDEKAPIAKVQVKETELKAVDAQRSLNKQAYLPDFFIRYRGYSGNEMTAKSEEAMIGITLPFLFFWQPQAESQGASAKYQRVQAELQKIQIESKSNIESLVAKINSLEKQLSTLESSLLPRAQKRMKLVANLSPRSMEGLNEHRNVMLNYLDLRLKSVETRLEFEKSVSELMTLISEKGLLE